MNLLGTLAKVAVGVMLARGAGRMIRGGGGGGGLGDLMGGLTRGGGAGDLLGGLLGGLAGGRAQGQGGGLGDLLGGVLSGGGSRASGGLGGWENCSKASAAPSVAKGVSARCSIARWPAKRCRRRRPRSIRRPRC